MEPATMQKEHEWLRRMLGEWRWESEPMSETGKPPMVCAGMDRVRLLGDLWIVCEGNGGVPGDTTHTNMMSLGFDPSSGRFVGTFIASVMTHLWVYDGALDASGEALVLHTEGPSFAGDGTRARYRDTITFVAEDHRTLGSEHQTPDGAWHRFMLAHYRRTTSR